MMIRILTVLALCLSVSAGTVQAQFLTMDEDNNTSDDSGNRMPPQVDPDPDAPSRLQEGEFEGVDQPIDEEDQEPYYFPQPHMFERPLMVGADQLNHYRGYWQPGGYDQRPGSPFFNSVPNAPPRGPLAGNGPRGMGGNMGGAYGYAGGNNSGYAGPGAYAGDYGYAGGYDAAYGDAYAGGYGYNYNSGYGYYGGNYGGGAGGAGAAGGDPYQYHFGPGYYRNSDYGHFRFPYYSYRRPWYHPGFAGYNRDTNIPW